MLEVGSLTLRPDGILHAVFDFETTGEGAAEYLAAREELIGSTVPPVIIEIVRMPFVERAVRTFLMSGMAPPPCRAIVSTDPTLINMWRSFNIVDPAKVPSEVFPTVERALEWIRTQMSSA